eukprot:scaffold7012_cov157-Amphora_coffeaeformis.AAC.12
MAEKAHVEYMKSYRALFSKVPGYLGPFQQNSWLLVSRFRTKEWRFKLSTQNPIPSDGGEAQDDYTKTHRVLFTPPHRTEKNGNKVQYRFNKRQIFRNVAASIQFLFVFCFRQSVTNQQQQTMTDEEIKDNAPAVAASLLKCIHHGAAAASVAQAVTWIPNSDNDKKSSLLVYASHAVVHLVAAVPISKGAAGKPTCNNSNNKVNELKQQKQPQEEKESQMGDQWQEHVLVGGETQQQQPQTAAVRRSMTAIAATWCDATTLAIVTGSSDGAVYYQLSFQNNSNNNSEPVNTIVTQQQQSLTTAALKSVAIVPQQRQQFADSNDDTRGGLWVLLGTAAPRHNRIHVYTTTTTTTTTTTEKQILRDAAETAQLLLYAGGLSGHQDWITCMDFNHGHNLLATGSQDGRIRLWRFVATTTTIPDNEPQEQQMAATTTAINSDSDEDDDDKVAEEEEQAGEARLEIRLQDPSQRQQTTTTHRVFLEAILFGHEEMVTAVTWHPNPQTTYGEDLLLISSSMDRSILLWTPSAEDGIWTPLTRGTLHVHTFMCPRRGERIGPTVVHAVEIGV